jgi:hypothetical protein
MFVPDDGSPHTDKQVLRVLVSCRRVCNLDRFSIQDTQRQEPTREYRPATRLVIFVLGAIREPNRISTNYYQPLWCVLGNLSTAQRKKKDGPRTSEKTRAHP